MNQHVLKLFPHWERVDHLYCIIGPQERDGGEDWTVIQLYKRVAKNSLERLETQKHLVDDVKRDDLPIVFVNPVIQY